MAKSHEWFGTATKATEFTDRVLLNEINLVLPGVILIEEFRAYKVNSSFVPSLQAKATNGLV